MNILPAPLRACRPPMRRGSALLTVALASPVLFGLLGLAIDFGHVQSAKMQLSSALDAASRYAAIGLSDSTSVVKAIAAAGQNVVDGTALTLTSANVSVGHYNASTRTFTVNGTPSDAVRVRIARTAGPQVVMSVTRAIGINSVAISGESFACDANLAGTAVTPTGPIKGFVALGSMSLSGAMTIRAWDSATNTTLNTATAWAAAQTGGSAAVNSVDLQGELQVAGAVTNNGSTITKGMTGSPGNLSSTYPAPTVPAGATNMGNYNGPTAATQTFGPGTYYFTSFNVPAGKTVIFSGAANVYFGGSCNITGDVTTYQNLPSNLKLYSNGAGVNIGASASSLYAEVYAPTAPVNLGGRNFYGSLITSTLSVSSTSTINVDARSTAGGFSTPVYTGPRVVNVLPTTVN